MKRTSFILAVAAASLVAGTSGAFADPVNLNIDDVNQTTTNHNNISNNGAIKQSGAISGNGASLSISAAGAVSSASANFVNAPEFNSVKIGTQGNTEVLTQQTTNKGAITNTNNTGAGKIDAGHVSGNGASVSVSASGGTSAVSVSSINNENANVANGVTLGPIDQATLNQGTINNQGGSLSVDNISGKGASASIGASGAVSVVSLSSIADNQQYGNVTVVGDIDQTSTNYANVNNTGVINAGALTGNGASASVSAMGAASSVSFSAIK